MTIQVIGPIMEHSDLEVMANRVFLKTIDILGGLNQLVKYRTLTWLSSLARASYVIVLKEEFFRTDEEIAAQVGITKNTVRAILRSDAQAVLAKIQNPDSFLQESQSKPLHMHLAGGIARLAYKFVKEGQDSQVVLELVRLMGMETAQVCDVPWAYLVLKKIKGVRYPIQGPEALESIFQDIQIQGQSMATLLPKLHYPIKSPAQLLHEIKLVLSA